MDDGFESQRGRCDGEGGEGCTNAASQPFIGCCGFHMQFLFIVCSKRGSHTSGEYQRVRTDTESVLRDSLIWLKTIVQHDIFGYYSMAFSRFSLTCIATYAAAMFHSLKWCFVHSFPSSIVMYIANTSSERRSLMAGLVLH